MDLSDSGSDNTVEAVIADFTTHRAEIEQAKGILMAIYNISAEHAFDILVWRSQETNTKLRKLVRQIIRDFTTALNVPSHVRERADHLLLTAHERAQRIRGKEQRHCDGLSDAHHAITVAHQAGQRHRSETPSPAPQLPSRQGFSAG